ncbi:hypothetical protein ID866_5774 [Astraeus odoratus]|nr:hypothetical protein ID866_5774 [Astraeus odoratus]
MLGYTDFGIWNISYQSVSCEHWDGWNDSSALGDVANLGYDSCCPNDPTQNSDDSCPSYSDEHGIPPYSQPGSAANIVPHFLPVVFTLLSTWTLL